MLDSFQLGWTHRPHRERSAGHTESAVGGEVAASSSLHPKLGRNAAVWGGFNEINKLTRQAAPAPEARGGQRLTKDQFVIAPRAGRGRGAGGSRLSTRERDQTPKGGVGRAQKQKKKDRIQQSWGGGPLSQHITLRTRASSLGVHPCACSPRERRWARWGPSRLSHQSSDPLHRGPARGEGEVKGTAERVSLDSHTCPQLC